jgi:hypothetical protein
MFDCWQSGHVGLDRLAHWGRGVPVDAAVAKALFSSLEWDVLLRNEFGDSVVARAMRAGKAIRSPRRLEKTSTISWEPQSAFLVSRWK